MLVRLLYASRAQGPVTHDVIESILQSSRQHNPAAGITGVLCHGGDVYMQVLEGGPGGKPKLTDWKGNYRDYPVAGEME